MEAFYLRQKESLLQIWWIFALGQQDYSNSEKNVKITLLDGWFEIRLFLNMSLNRHFSNLGLGTKMVQHRKVIYCYFHFVFNDKNDILPRGLKPNFILFVKIKNLFFNRLDQLDSAWFWRLPLRSRTWNVARVWAGKSNFKVIRKHYDFLIRKKFKTILNDLRSNGWLDNGTSLLFFEQTYFNPNINSFSQLRISFERAPGGIYQERSQKFTFRNSEDSPKSIICYEVFLKILMSARHNWE